MRQCKSPRVLFLCCTPPRLYTLHATNVLEIQKVVRWRDGEVARWRGGGVLVAGGEVEKKAWWRGGVVAAWRRGGEVARSYFISLNAAQQYSDGRGGMGGLRDFGTGIDEPASVDA